MSAPARLPRHSQAGALVLAGLLWALFPLPTLSALVWAYLAVVLLLGLARGRGARWAELPAPAPLAVGLGLALSIPAAVYLARSGRDIASNDQLDGLRPVLRDRARLAAEPQVHPPILAAGRPQTSWIRASDAEAAGLDLGNGVAATTRVAPGVFRWRGPVPARVLQPTLHLDGRASPLPVRVIPARPRPRALEPDPAGGALAVSEETDELLIIGAEPGQLTRIPVGDGPLRAVRMGDAVVVAHRHDPDLWWVTPEQPPRRHLGPAASEARRGAATDALHDLAVDGDTLWLARTSSAGPGVLALSGARRRWWPLPGTPDRIVARGGRVVVASRAAGGLLRVAPAAAAPLPLSRPAVALVSRGAELWAVVSDLLPPGDPGANHQLTEQLLRVDVDDWRLRRATPTAVTDEDDEVVDGAGAAGLSDAQGDLLIAFAGTSTLQLRGGRRAPSPLPAPDGVVAVAGGLYVVSSAAAGAIAWVDDAGAARAVVRLDRDDDPQVALLRAGERAFVEATRSGASCASCHPDADSDHAWHDIGHGVPRPTLSVRGVAGTAPFLRGASYPDLSGLDHFAASLLGGYRRAEPRRAEALAAFVLSLPPLAAPRDPPQDDLRRGYAAFEAAGCPACHPPPAFTDLAQVPAQVLFPEQPAGVLLDTPSLLSVAATPPYLFDGRAATLAEVFREHDDAGRHGAFGRLDPAAQADLLAFLEAL
jgi:hypothetical protein